jgi:hypothetical protein
MRYLLPCLVVFPALAHASSTKVLLVAGRAGKILRNRAIQARIGERISIHVVVRQRVGGRMRTYTDAPLIALDGRRIRPPRLRPLAELGGLSAITWHRVEPHPHHTDATAFPNKGNPAYSNAVLFGPDHGRWLGYDRIEYHQTPIAGASGGTLTVTRTRPSHPRININGGLGTMRYGVTLRLNDEVLSSPGAQALIRGGISPRVMRVTFRSNDSFVGYLRGYFNVPNVFGSGGSGRTHQAELYQGADCADVIIGAARAAGSRLPYTSVLGLKRYTQAVTGRLLMTKEGIFSADDQDTRQRVRLRFGSDVYPGDIMLIDYVGFDGSPRTWDHIAVIDRDGGVSGELDPQDPILHMGYLFGLTEEPAWEEAPAHIKILRFRSGVRRAFARSSAGRR